MEFLVSKSDKLAQTPVLVYVQMLILPFFY